MEQQKQPEYLRPEDLAATYGVHRATVRNWIKKGVPCRGRQLRLRAEKIGRLWRVPRASWEEFWRALNPDGVETAESAADRRRAQTEAERRLDARLNPPGRRRPGKRTAPRPPPAAPTTPAPSAPPEIPPPPASPLGRAVVDALAGGALFPEQIAARVGAPFDADFRAALCGLAASGVLRRKGGRYRTGRPAAPPA